MADLQHPGASNPDSQSHQETSRSTPLSLQLGTGFSIYTNTLIPAILSAKHEIILVTCFWAPSKTLTALGDTLEKVATKRRTLISEGHSLSPLRISICLSSRSLLQKLFHTSSTDGYLYPPSLWPKKLGLPSQAALEAGGVSMTVKSLFFLPFSVMHPKFIIIDRQHAFVPSCNISWEAWLEGCVEISGPAIADLLAFYSGTWDKDLDIRSRFPPPAEENGRRSVVDPSAVPVTHYSHVFPSSRDDITTLILPSPHHRNPHFRPFPWQAAAPVPSTPLNVTLLRLFEEARHHIYVQTPNLTCAPVISALLAALQRGVHVTIVTSRNMMLLEQLVTAGTTTSWCVRSMVRRYKSMSSTTDAPTPTRGYRRISREGSGARDLESQRPRLGKLTISYFHPHQGGGSGGSSRQPDVEAGISSGIEEPVHSHLKLTITDGRYTVLGSGNMDRASWYTSQELGILFDNADFAATTKGAVDQVLNGRLELIFDTEATSRRP